MKLIIFACLALYAVEASVIPETKEMDDKIVRRFDSAMTEAEFETKDHERKLPLGIFGLKFPIISKLFYKPFDHKDDPVEILGKKVLLLTKEIAILKELISKHIHISIDFTTAEPATTPTTEPTPTPTTEEPATTPTTEPTPTPTTEEPTPTTEEPTPTTEEPTPTTEEPTPTTAIPYSLRELLLL